MVVVHNLCCSSSQCHSKNKLDPRVSPDATSKDQFNQFEGVKAETESFETDIYSMSPDERKRRHAMLEWPCNESVHICLSTPGPSCQSHTEPCT